MIGPVMKKLLIYVIGLAPLAFAQEWLRATINELPAFGVAILYLVMLRALAEKFGK